MIAQSLLAVSLAQACVAGLLYLRARPVVPAVRRFGALFVLLLLVGVPTLLQTRYPSLRAAFQRDARSIWAGQWWRLATALCVQDGGMAGSTFNLIGLACVGGIAERLWGSRRLLVTFFLGGILSELVALSWQPIGAGNSVANFSLAGSVCVACLARPATRQVQATAWMAVAAWVALLGLRDIHGAAALFGTLAGASFLGRDRESYNRSPA